MFRETGEGRGVEVGPFQQSMGLTRHSCSPRAWKGLAHWKAPRGLTGPALAPCVPPAPCLSLIQPSSHLETSFCDTRIFADISESRLALCVLRGLRC